MTTKTTVIDLTDRIVTAELPAQRVATAIIPAVVRIADDTSRIPTYEGKPMLPPVPAARRPLTVPAKHRAPSHRPALLLTALTVGGLVAPLVLR